MRKIILILILIQILSCSDNSDSEPENLNCPNTSDPTNMNEFYYGPIASEEVLILQNLNIEYFPANDSDNPDDSFGKYYEISGEVENLGDDEINGIMYFVLNVGGVREIIGTPGFCSTLLMNEICGFNVSVTRNLDFNEDPNPQLICFFYQIEE